MYYVAATAFVTQGMVADKLTAAVIAVIILLVFVAFLTVFLYICALAVGAVKFYGYFHT